MTQTNKFKAGDKVRCINNGGNSYITVGKEYIVDEVYSSDCLRTSCDHIDEYYIYENELFELVKEPEDKPKAHKHKELIIAWANGAKIEYHYMKHCGAKEWRIASTPTWDEDSEYRIALEPKPDVVKTMFVEADPCLDNAYDSHNLKLTFCGETGKLKSAEVIN